VAIRHEHRHKAPSNGAIRAGNKDPHGGPPFSSLHPRRDRAGWRETREGASRLDRRELLDGIDAIGHDGAVDHRSLQQAADANFLASFRKLVENIPAGELRETGAVFAFMSGLPFGPFNGCVIVAPPVRSELEAAIRWLLANKFPFRVWIREELAPSLSAVPRRHGLVEDERRFPGMALAPMPDAPRLPPGVTLRDVADEHSLEEHRGILVASGMDPLVARPMLPEAFLTDPDVALTTVLLDGEPVGHSLAIRSGDVCGIYNVGTLPSARRRGVGTAATWAAVAAGRRWGCRVAVLQSSEMGQSIYEAIGFRTVVRYAEFRLPR
jgi:GNAT superfamily N-acetyltransferase